MNGRIAQKFGDLGKIHVIFTDQLLGEADFHPGKKLNNTVSIFLSKHFLQLGSADQVIVADIFDCHTFPDPFLQITDNFPAGQGGGSRIVKFPGRIAERRLITAEHMDQKLLQVSEKKLLGTKKDLASLFHFLGVGIIQRGGKAVAGFSNDLPQQRAFCIGKFQDFMFKKTHAGGAAGKGHHNDIGGIFAGCFQIVKFVGLVENYLASAQDMAGIAGTHLRFPLVHTLKFPEIMLLSGIIKIISVFKIMDRIDPVNRKLLFKKNAFVRHMDFLQSKSVI